VYACNCVVPPSFECVMTHANVENNSRIWHVKGRQYVCVCVGEIVCVCARTIGRDSVCADMMGDIFISIKYLETTRKKGAQRNGKRERERES